MLKLAQLFQNIYEIIQHFSLSIFLDFWLAEKPVRSSHWSTMIVLGIRRRSLTPTELFVRIEYFLVISSRKTLRLWMQILWDFWVKIINRQWIASPRKALKILPSLAGILSQMGFGKKNEAKWSNLEINYHSAPIEWLMGSPRGNLARSFSRDQSYGRRLKISSSSSQRLFTQQLSNREQKSFSNFVIKFRCLLLISSRWSHVKPNCVASQEIQWALHVKRWNTTPSSQCHRTSSVRFATCDSL